MKGFWRFAADTVELEPVSQTRLTASHDERDQPSLKLRRSAEALAKAEAHDDHEEDSLKKFFASVVSFEIVVMVS